ncbi:hypothetical protein [Ramlibacter albus]|nr:hypothetical protein [Ramlibacter albus]
MTLKARIAAYTAALLALLGVFVLYTQPQMMVTVSEMVWACFGA